MSMSFCHQCGAAIENANRFCAACGASVADALSTVPSNIGDHSSNGASRLFTYARRAKIVALVGFVMPWATVSCSGQRVMDLSGLNMAFGFVWLQNPLTGETISHAGHLSIAVLAGLLLTVATLLFVRSASNRYSEADLLCSVAAALAVIGGAVAAFGRAQQHAEAVGFQVAVRPGFAVSAIGLVSVVILLDKRRRMLTRCVAEPTPRRRFPRIVNTKG